MSQTLKRLSKNTMFLYIRMVLLMIISLYTGRVVLDTLGVDDFGIYSVVGSLTATFYSLRSVFAEAVQRFLNFEKGKNNLNGEIVVFNIAVVLHLIIALVFIVLVELIGLWFMGHKLVIAPERLDAAYFVFHFTVISLFFGILIIPYDALIIANERMNVYAWVSILDGIVRLLIILAIPFLPFDYLKDYAFLLAIVPIANLIIYFVYCRRFPECRYTLCINRNKIREIFMFSSWSFIGNLFFTLAHEGINLLINMFGGVAFNASRNIAYQIRSAASQVSNNTLLAIKPFILQNAAQRNGEELMEYTIKVSRVNFFIMALTCIPVICFCPQLLSLWLVDVPEGAAFFTQLLVFSVLIRCLHGPIDLFYMGLGRIKRMVIIESILFIIYVVICYFQLYLSLPIWSVFATLNIFEVLIVLSLAINIKKEFDIDISSYLYRGFVPCMVLALLSVPVVGVFMIYKMHVFIGLLLSCLIELTVISVMLNKEERSYVGAGISKLKNYLN